MHSVHKLNFYCASLSPILANVRSIICFSGLFCVTFSFLVLRQNPQIFLSLIGDENKAKCRRKKTTKKLKERRSNGTGKRNDHVNFAMFDLRRMSRNFLPFFARRRKCIPSAAEFLSSAVRSAAKPLSAPLSHHWLNRTTFHFLLTTWLWPLLLWLSLSYLSLLPSLRSKVREKKFPNIWRLGRIWENVAKPSPSINDLRLTIRKVGVVNTADRVTHLDLLRLPWLPCTLNKHGSSSCKYLAGTGKELNPALSSGFPLKFDSFDLSLKAGEEEEEKGNNLPEENLKAVRNPRKRCRIWTYRNPIRLSLQ